MSARHGKSRQGKLPRQDNFSENNSADIEFDIKQPRQSTQADTLKQTNLPLIRLEEHGKNDDCNDQKEKKCQNMSETNQNTKQNYLAVCSSEATLPHFDRKKIVRPQRSCESNDSATSGMSWSSSQSGIDRQKCNSGSISSHPSFSGTDESQSMKWDNMQTVKFQRPQQHQDEIEIHLRKLSVREICTPKSSFMTGYSFDENEERLVSQADIVQGRAAQSLWGENYDESEIDESREYSSDEEKKPDNQSINDTYVHIEEKKVKPFWKRAFANMRSHSVPDKHFDRNKVIKNKTSLDLAPTIHEVDPIYELLRIAASRHPKQLNNTESNPRTLSDVKRENSECSNSSISRP